MIFTELPPLKVYLFPFRNILNHFEKKKKYNRKCLFSMSASLFVL